MNRRHVLTTLAATAFIPAVMAAPQLLAADNTVMGDAEKKHAEMTKMTGAPISDYQDRRFIPPWNR
jgi:hypothetical protein